MDCSICGHSETAEFEVRLPLTRLTSSDSFNYVKFHWCPRCGTLYEKRSVAEIIYWPRVPSEVKANLPLKELDPSYDASTANTIISEYTELFGEKLLNYLIDLEKDIDETLDSWKNRNSLNPLFQYEYVQNYGNVIFLDEHIKQALCFMKDPRVINKEFYRSFVNSVKN